MLAVPVALTCAYLLVMTLLSRRASAPPASSRLLCFDVVVPAHDEAAGIGETLESLKVLDWPADRFRITVVADNCSDDTAARARATGVEVLVRSDSTRRGKGYALQTAFEHSVAFGWADALVVVDADTAASPALLEAFACRIERGAGVVQAHYGVRNRDASWRTRLMSIALGSFHRVRSRAREVLELSCGLRGNGWCVTQRVLADVPYLAFSLTEDVEYGIELGLAGHRVAYADEAEVAGVMVSGASAAAVQRHRWEHGRLELIRTSLPRLFSRTAGPIDRVRLDLAADLLVAPLSLVAIGVGAWLAVAAIAARVDPRFAPWLWAGALAALSLVAYVARGWQLSGVGARGLLDLARAPWFVVWKVLSALRTRPSTHWVRTERERQ